MSKKFGIGQNFHLASTMRSAYWSNGNSEHKSMQVILFVRCHFNVKKRKLTDQVHLIWYTGNTCGLKWTLFVYSCHYMHSFTTLLYQAPVLHVVVSCIENMESITIVIIMSLGLLCCHYCLGNHHQHHHHRRRRHHHRHRQSCTNNFCCIISGPAHLFVSSCPTVHWYDINYVIINQQLINLL